MLKNRKQIEKLIYDTFDALDPSGTNTQKYRDMFEPMSDVEFEKFIRNFVNSEDNFILDIDEYDRRITMDKCRKAAEVLNIPLEEYVYMPHLTMDRKNVIVSREKCLVGWINVKRTQQLVHKKNGLALESEKVQHLTGQVTGKDKSARDSEIEAMMLVSLGADKILQELHGPRADDVVMKRQMMTEIANKGYVSLEELDNLPINKTTLNTVNTYLIGMQIKSDLITDGYILNTILADTVKAAEKRDSKMNQ
jgi:hypothetical protein